MTIEEAVSSARAAFIERHPNSRKQHETASAYLPGGNTRTVLYYDPFPLTITRGQGSRLWDADGHEYTDFLGEFTAGIYGHSHPVIRAALMEALDNGINLTGHNLLEAELARLVTSRIPSMQRIRFTNSGTEANLMAIATAKSFTNRNAVLVFTGGYHGGVLTFGSGPSRINVPHRFLYGRYNDLASVKELVKDHLQDLAAILVEPMQGSAGCIVGEREFLTGLREIADESGALLIFDEVMTSRLSPGGLQQVLGITPDLTTIGKYIGGGMSFGGFGGREDVMAQFDPRRENHLPHAGTFNNNVMTMAAGIAGLSRLYTPEAAVALTARGNALRERLNALCRRYAANMQFTGTGSLMNVHGSATPIRSVEDLAATRQEVRDLFFFHMNEEGFYVAKRGFIVLSLPLTDDDLARFERATEKFLAKYRDILTTV